jgi:hypothetical protein
MKHLTTIAVVGKPVLRQVQRIAAAANPTVTHRAYQNGVFNATDPKSGSARSMERILWSALDDNIENVCFFRTLMDGWDAPHRSLLSWLETNRPSATASWKRFIKMGFLILTPQAGQRLLPCPSARDLRGLRTQFRLEGYALTAFVAALYDGLTFQACTGLPLILTARCVGGSMGDEEYRKMWLDARS